MSVCITLENLFLLVPNRDQLQSLLSGNKTKISKICYSNSRKVPFLNLFRRKNFVEIYPDDWPTLVTIRLVTSMENMGVPQTKTIEHTAEIWKIVSK